MKEISVVIASDNNYFPYVYAAIYSLFQSNAEMAINVYYIQQEVDEKNIDLLKKLEESYGQNIIIKSFDMPQEFWDCLPAFVNNSKTTYAKFWFASMFPELDRVLYLDPDVLVLRSIKDLFYMDFENNLIAGVYENLPSYHRTASHLEISDPYINGGMVLCNLNLWREEEFEKTAEKRLRDTSHNYNFDQGILNEICKGRIKVLEPKYCALAEIFEIADAEKLKKRYEIPNYYSQEQIDEAINNPIIVHFTGFFYGKPLSKRCTHPYTKVFQKILINNNMENTIYEKKIPIGKKIRKFVLHNFPYVIYLKFEKILDVHRRREMLGR